MDSPKCLDCLKLGNSGQTYKIAGRPLYKCSDCKSVYGTDKFKVCEFLWRKEPEAYMAFLKEKGIVLGAKIL